MVLKNALVFSVFVIVSVASRPSSPLIKNVYPGGIHFEGPHWSTSENALYWVDISGQKVLRLDETGNVTTKDIVLDYADACYLALTEDQLNKLERLQYLYIRFI